jgi:hypothetical protein
MTDFFALREELILKRLVQTQYRASHLLLSDYHRWSRIRTGTWGTSTMLASKRENIRIRLGLTLVNALNDVPKLIQVF